jgi:hypothetical protein
VGTPTCDPQGNPIGQPGGQPGATTTVSKDDTLGGDKDDDGIPNAFDVNDDGDEILDSADATTPAPKVAVDDGTKDCSAVDFRIFTNYKATQGGYAGTINAYAPGAFKATKENIASTITKSMTMVFSVFRMPLLITCLSVVGFATQAITSGQSARASSAPEPATRQRSVDTHLPDLICQPDKTPSQCA